jgi:hypothetical protein
MTSINQTSTSSLGISREEAILLYDKVREGVFDNVARVRRRILRSALDWSMSISAWEASGEYDYLQAMRDEIL